VRLLAPLEQLETCRSDSRILVAAPGLAVLRDLPAKAQAPSLSPSAFGAISQLASAHAIIAVALTGVVALQGAQYYSERQIEKEVKRVMTEASSSSRPGSVPASPARQPKQQHQQQQQQMHQPQRSVPNSPLKQQAGSADGLSVPSGDGNASLRRSPRKKR
jgi:hypothetical protein